MHASVTYLHPMECADGTPRGGLRARKLLEVTDIFGNKRFRRISLGTAHCVTMDHAKSMVQNLRLAEPNAQAEFTVIL